MKDCKGCARRRQRLIDAKDRLLAMVTGKPQHTELNNNAKVKEMDDKK